MNSSEKDSPILVLGATGKTGRRVAERLQRLGMAVRPGHRGAAIPFDWQDSAGWQAALRGVKKVYLSYQPDLAAPGAVATVAHFCVWR